MEELRMGEEKVTCGQCRKFVKFNQRHGTGYCCADLPAWADLLIKQTPTLNDVGENSTWAEECDLFSPKVGLK
jgi:hypothetical protein